MIRSHPYASINWIRFIGLAPVPLVRPRHTSQLNRAPRWGSYTILPAGESGKHRCRQDRQNLPAK